MGHHDYDNGPPPDEEAEDFRNFDPETYLRKRGRGTSDAFSDQEPTDENAEDFAKFDPDAYLRKRRAERGQPPLGGADSYPVDMEPPSRRRRRSVADDSESIPDVGAAAGLGAGIIGMFGSREATRLNVEILRHSSPLIRAALIALGCAIVLTLTGVCVVGFLLATAIARR
jgi:hypothetical protein